MVDPERSPEHVMDELNDQLEPVETEQERIYKRYNQQERLTLIDKMLERKYRGKATWDEIADAFGVARSTIRRWRLGDEWRLAEARWRRVMREEARSDTTMLGQDALGVLQDLMHNARSEFVRYSSAGKILDLIGVGDEIEETKVDQASELMRFIEKVRTRQTETQHLLAQGIDPDTVLEAEVRPGGMLPEIVVHQNEEIMAARLAEQDELRRLISEDETDDEGDGIGDELTPD
jgi:hypothetical protein